MTINILDVNRSWLYFMSEHLSNLDEPIDFIFQENQIRTNDDGQIEIASDFVIISPLNQWQEIDEPGVIEVNFRIAVVTGQEPGQILSAHYRNLMIQKTIQQAFFAPERLLTGNSTGGRRNYAIPYLRFLENGDLDTELDPEGLQYSQGNIWNDNTPTGSDPQIWVLEIPVRVSSTEF